MEFDVPWNVLQCRMRDVAPLCRIWCNVEYVRYGVMLRHAVSRMVWNVVMRCGIMVWYMWNMVVCRERCKMWSWNKVMWNGLTLLDIAVWCRMMVEMQCRMCAVGLWCAIYIWMWWCAWHVEWGTEMWRIMVRCEMWCDVSIRQMWCDVECCSFRHGVG